MMRASFIALDFFYRDRQFMHWCFRRFTHLITKVVLPTFPPGRGSVQVHELAGYPDVRAYLETAQFCLGLVPPRAMHASIYDVTKEIANVARKHHLQYWADTRSIHEEKSGDGGEEPSSG